MFFGFLFLFLFDTCWQRFKIMTSIQSKTKSQWNIRYSFERLYLSQHLLKYIHCILRCLTLIFMMKTSFNRKMSLIVKVKMYQTTKIIVILVFPNSNFNTLGYCIVCRLTYNSFPLIERQLNLLNECIKNLIS